MKSMNRKEGKKIAVMAAVIVGLMMFAFMPLASAVDSFAVTPSTGLVGAVDSYNILVTTTGVRGINITIPAEFIAVAPTTGGVLIAEVNFWNSTRKAYYGHATITSDDTNWTEQVEVDCKFGGDSVTTIQDVNYTAGATTTIGSGFTVAEGFSINDTSSVIIELPTEGADGSIKIDINCTEFCTEFQLDDVHIAIGQFVRNPLNAWNYKFTADDGVGDEVNALVGINDPSGRGIVFRDGVWFVDTNGNHIADVVFNYGTTGDVPLVWGDNGVAKFTNGRWCIRSDHCFNYGIGDDVPLVGDIDQDGTDDIAVFRNGTWYVSTAGNHVNPVADVVFNYGIADDIPLVGDINQDGTDDIAVFRDGTWYVCTTDNRVNPVADLVFDHGPPGGIPVVGDIDQDGTDDIAVFKDGMWYVDTEGGDGEDDLSYAYGITGDIPLVGIIE